MLNWICSLQLILIIFTSFATCEINIPKELENEPNLGKPGVKARLSQKGINYVAGILANSLIAEIAISDIAIEPITIEIPEDKIKISNMNLKIETSAQNLHTTTKEPNQVFIEIPDMKFIINTQLNNLLENNVQFQANNARILLVFSILKTSQGSPNLQMNKCQVKITADVPINVILNTGAKFKDIQKEKLQSTLEKRSLELLDGLICSRIGFVIDDRFNDRFSLLPLKVTLAHVGENQIVQDLIAQLRARRQRSVTNMEFQRMPMKQMKRQQQMIPSNFEQMIQRNKRETLMNSFNVSYVDNLFLDYTIFADPLINTLGFEFESSGEVSLRGRGGTPFGAVNFKLPNTVNEEYMLQMAVSDFVPNSLMYHGHTIGLFNARMDPNTPHFGSILRTTCTISTGLLFCLGDIFPTLRRLHPNHHLVLFFNTMQAPVIRFKPPIAGGITFRLNGRIVVLIIDNADPSQETQVAEMALYINAHMKMRLINGSVKPKILLNTMKLTTLSPGVLLQQELDDAVMLAREVLQRIANDVLKDGFPVPVHPLFKLNKPKVRFLERTMLIQANIELNERLLRQLTAPDLLSLAETKQFNTTAKSTKS